MTVDQVKHAYRDRVWDLLESECAVESDPHGRIPAFIGADAAAEVLATVPAWKESKVVKTVPDTAQLPVRARALIDQKIVYMAVPRLASPKPFSLIDPTKLSVSAAEAAKKEVATRIARNVDVDEMRPVDLVVLGSVAVNRQGARLGKGAGYSDIELALLQEADLIGSRTVIATTVHQLQIVDGQLPESDHDFRIDLIVTPHDVIWCDEPRRPAGLLWESLSPEKIAAIPALTIRDQERRAAGLTP